MIYSQTYQSPMGPILITIDTRLNSLIELKICKNIFIQFQTTTINKKNNKTTR